MSLELYVTYLNNMLRHVNRYRPLQLSRYSPLEDILGTAQDLDDLAFVDALVKRLGGQEIFFDSFDFLNEPLVLGSLSQILNSDVSQELKNAILENLGSLGHADSLVDFESSGVSEFFMGYQAAKDSFDRDYAQSGILQKLMEVTARTDDDLDAAQDDNEDLQSEATSEYDMAMDVEEEDTLQEDTSSDSFDYAMNMEEDDEDLEDSSEDSSYDMNMDEEDEDFEDSPEETSYDMNMNEEDEDTETPGASADLLPTDQKEASTSSPESQSASEYNMAMEEEDEIDGFEEPEFEFDMNMEDDDTEEDLEDSEQQETDQYVMAMDDEEDEIESSDSEATSSQEDTGVTTISDLSSVFVEDEFNMNMEDLEEDIIEDSEDSEEFEMNMDEESEDDDIEEQSEESDFTMFIGDEEDDLEPLSDDQDSFEEVSPDLDHKGSSFHTHHDIAIHDSVDNPFHDFVAGGSLGGDPVPTQFQPATQVARRPEDALAEGMLNVSNKVSDLFTKGVLKAIKTAKSMKVDDKDE